MKIALVDDEHYYLDEMERLCLDFGKCCHLHIETVLFDSGEAFLDAFEDGSRLPIRVRNRLQIEQAVQDYNFSKIRQGQYRHTIQTAQRPYNEYG